MAVVLPRIIPRLDWASGRIDRGALNRCFRHRLAKQVLAQSEKDNPRHVGEADFFSRYAVKLAPQDAEVAKIRAEIEEQIKSLPKP